MAIYSFCEIKYSSWYLVYVCNSSPHSKMPESLLPSPALSRNFCCSIFRKAGKQDSPLRESRSSQKHQNVLSTTGTHGKLTDCCISIEFFGIQIALTISWEKECFLTIVKAISVWNFSDFFPHIARWFRCLASLSGFPWKSSSTWINDCLGAIFSLSSLGAPVCQMEVVGKVIWR